MKIITTNNITSSILEVGKLVKGYGKLTSPKCYIFSEDKINLLTQIEIAKSLGGGFFNIENLTFKRYISSKRSDGVLSNEASAMVIRKIIQDNKKSLRCFKGATSLSNLAKTLFELISQLKSANVTVENIENLLQNEYNTLSTNLFNKLSDINLIYSNYQNYLTTNGVFDSYEYLSIMPSLIESDEDLKDATVIVVGYTSITKQRELIFKALNEKTKNFIAIVVSDEKGNFYTNEILNRIKTTNCQIEKSQFDDCINGDASILQQHLYDKSIYKDDYVKPKTKDITISSFKTPYDEIEHVAVDIISNVKNNTARYKDIAVTIGNLSEYSTILKRVFDKYDIPYYIDEHKVLTDHPLIYFIVDTLELARKNLAPSDVKNLARNLLFISDKTLADGFCNYVDKFSISRKTIKEPFTYKDANLELYENIRIQIIEIYKLLSSSKKVGDFVDAIKKILTIINVEDKLNLLNEKLQKAEKQSLIQFNEKVLEKLDNILNELLLVIKDSPIDVTDFKNVFLSGADACKISGIPLFMDAVFVSNLIDVKLKSPIILYAVGICGDIPASKSDIALLSDKDIDKLCSQHYEKYQVSIEPKIQLVNKREVQNVCTTLISFKNKLKISFPILSINGQINLKSDIVKNILAIYDTEIINMQNHKLVNKYTSDFHALLINSLTSPEIAIKRIIKLISDNNFETYLESQLIATLYATLERLNLKEHIAVLDNLLKKENKFSVTSENALLCINNKEISATTLESYYACPFYNFAKGSLRLYEKEDGQVKNTERGTILHNLLEIFVKRLDQVTDKQSCEKLSDEIFESLICKEEYQIYLSKPNYAYIFDRLKDEARRVTYNLFLTSKNSSFVPTMFEKAFGDNKELKGIPLYAESGKYSVKGKVDRVDVYQNRVRIIDYKSGKIDISPTQFYVGKKLQLYLYMNAFLQNGFKPAGAYYSSIDGLFKPENSTQIALQGRTLDLDEIIKATDNQALSLKRSDVINAYTKAGKKNLEHAFLTESEFYDYLDYSKLIAVNAINEISLGFIHPTPYEKSCEYCKFNGMCDFCLNEDGKERKLTSIKKDTIINAVKNSNDVKNKKEH